jgi:Spy/CpxP family protein refolding chaperone
MKRSIVVIALLVAPLAARIDAQGPPGGGTPGPAHGQPDPFGRHLFPPELVMQHQGQINLQDSQRAALQAAIAQAQTRFVDAQWKISAEGEKLARLLQTPTVDEKLVLEQVDRILDIEREVKRAQMGLMVRIKNTLTPSQQAKLRELRGSE